MNLLKVPFDNLNSILSGNLGKDVFVAMHVCCVSNYQLETLQDYFPYLELTLSTKCLETQWNHITYSHLPKGIACYVFLEIRASRHSNAKNILQPVLICF